MKTDDEINQIVSRVLHDKFPDFEGSAVKSETDFDGTPIIRGPRDIATLKCLPIVASRWFMTSEPNCSRAGKSGSYFC